LLLLCEVNPIFIFTIVFKMIFFRQFVIDTNINMTMINVFFFRQFIINFKMILKWVRFLDF